MNRGQKEDFISSFEKKLQESTGAFLIGYKGLNVADVTQLRKKLKDKRGVFKVTKVTLLKRIIEHSKNLQSWDPYLKDQIAVVFSYEQPTTVAKILQDFAKTNKRLTIIAGSVENTFLDAQDFAVYVNLPSREVLLAQVLGTMQAPMTHFVVVLKMLISRLVFVLKQIEEQKGKYNSN